MSTLAPFKELVRKRCGLQLDGMAEARLNKALDTLRATTGLDDAVAQLARLERDSALFDHFISQLTVNETYFFREPDALDWLVDTHLPERLAAKGAPLSILSAGCSSGEEPYSLAMALFERYGERATRLFTLAGGDVDQQILGKARQGIYGGMAFRALHPALKLRYFESHRHLYKISDTLRRWVTFHPFNLLQPAANALHGPFDVILFRNVSIYFDEPTRRRIQQYLHRLLAPQGIMLCGVAETLGNDLGVFTLAQSKDVFYFRPDKLPAAPSLAPAWVADTRVPALPDAPSAPPAVTLQAPPPEPPVPDESSSSFTQELQRAHRLLDQNAFQQAAELLEALLIRQPWSVDVLLLSGLVARWQQAPEQAYGFFKRAIYTAPDCWPAHFYKAELFRQGELADDPVQCRHGYSAVIRLLDEAPTASGGLQTITSPLPPGDARFLANRHLDALLATQGAS
ncbi:chemotaxis protein methyltransferase CheR [Vreelandella songnenensis]|uniref:Chemotaxis protein methyltransferase CheR n=1 Tax=Vreelandella songnenensis TaxID=1176243 RepID=A0A2T0V1Z3_9GAMM|nr:protein-glutamate O-methyltransferase CheR [Halomonas songnenensis]PRY64181.1 chemotaxis protein methyltransferase CheR [Halomonas songnenensis]